LFSGKGEKRGKKTERHLKCTTAAAEMPSSFFIGTGDRTLLLRTVKQLPPLVKELFSEKDSQKKGERERERE